MRLSKGTTILIQALLALGIMSFCTWNGLSWIGISTLGALVAIAMLASVSATDARDAVACEAALTWGCTIIAIMALLQQHNYWNQRGTESASVVAWATAVALLPTLRISGQLARLRNWKIQIWFWSFFGALLLLYDACSQNKPLIFYSGLMITCLLLIGCKFWFRLPTSLILILNTTSLLAIGLPVADLFVRPLVDMRRNGQVKTTHYSRKSATHPGRTYECWEPVISAEWTRMRQTICVGDHGPPKGTRYRFQPNTTFRFYHGAIRINNLGFRGRDITTSKGNVFRIVAIGESTTFGLTLNPSDRPWPELLEEMIRTRLELRRPVEVINAGFPASTIEDSLWRLEKEILALKPDMIISYHGINGFYLIDDAIPPLSDRNAPKYTDRPLTLFANLEYRWQIQRFNRHRATKLEQHPPTFQNVLNSRYAADIRRLADICKTNRIELVVGTFSLAVNRRSEAEVVDFYRESYPNVDWTIKANEAYTRILAGLAQEDPTIHLVDTHPGLDGEYSKFTDVMHLTQPGRQNIADAFFAGIQELLKSGVPGDF